MSQKEAQQYQAAQNQPQETPRPGHVKVTFDAGGKGSEVDSNPQSFRKSKTDPDSFFVHWKIVDRRNINGDFNAEFGNVTPCHIQDLPDGYRFRSRPTIDQRTKEQTGWLWKFTRTDPNAPPPADLTGEIEYEIFFAYQMKAQQIQPPARRTVSLRKSIQVDPSMILPPRDPSGGGGDDETF